MQRNETPEADRSFAVTPSIQIRAPWRVASVRAVSDMRLHVVFVDGTEGDVDMEHFLSDEKIDGTLFEPLRRPEIFKQASIELGAVRWPTGADIAPDSMYDEIRNHGSWMMGN